MGRIRRTLETHQNGIESVRRLRINREGQAETEELVSCPKTSALKYIDDCVRCGHADGILFRGQDAVVNCRLPFVDAEYRTKPRDRSPTSAVTEIMSREPKTLSPEQTIESAVFLFEQNSFSAAPVTTNGRLEGMLSTKDLFQYAAHNGSLLESPQVLDELIASGLGIRAAEYIVRDYPHLCVKDVMTSEVFALRDDAPIRSAALLMLHEGFHHVPILSHKNDKLVGIVSTGDVLRWLAA